MLVSGGENGHRKFAFIHIQKTGGSSVDELLRTTVPDITHYGPRHMGARHAMTKIEDWDDYYRFAFVRNPWDRLVSWYCMMDQRRRRHAGRLEGPPLSAKGKRRLRRSPLLRDVLENAPTFEDFIKRCNREFKVRGTTYSFTRNQLDYLTDKNGEFLVDFVGRFERFHEDLATVLDVIGLDVPLDAIPHRNASTRRHYSTFYMPETENIVRERFRKDIEYFGYEFERPHLYHSIELTEEKSLQPEREITFLKSRLAEERRQREKQVQRLQSKNRILAKRLEKVETSRSWRLMNGLARIRARMVRKNTSGE
jgi:hypothetical protein